jgi:acetoin utilization deacetylase AcuC-like enzyme
MICQVAEQTCGGRVVSTLEGGYDLDALAESAAAHVRALMGH